MAVLFLAICLFIIFVTRTPGLAAVKNATQTAGGPANILSSDEFIQTVKDKVMEEFNKKKEEMAKDET